MFPTLAHLTEFKYSGSVPQEVDVLFNVLRRTLSRCRPKLSGYLNAGLMYSRTLNEPPKLPDLESFELWNVIFTVTTKRTQCTFLSNEKLSVIFQNRSK